MSDIVRMSDIRFSWGGENAFSLHMDSFNVRKGEKLLLLGPSGSGKSTFLSLLCGVVEPQAGVIEILETNLKTLGAAGRDKFRAEHFGIIFQMFNLLPYGSVIDNVVLPLSFASGRRERVLKKGGIHEEAARLLQRLGLGPELLGNKSASTLSVGQQQRVAAARALIGSPEIIVADEPTSSLDRQRQGDFLELLSEEVSRAEAALIMVSHDESLKSSFDRVIQIDNLINVEREAAQ